MNSNKSKLYAVVGILLTGLVVFMPLSLSAQSGQSATTTGTATSGLQAVDNPFVNTSTTATTGTAATNAGTATSGLQAVDSPFINTSTSATTTTGGAASQNSLTGGSASSGSYSCANISYQSIGTMIGFIFCLIEAYLVPIMLTLAVVLFFFGVASFILHSDDEEARQKGKKFIIWGLLSIFVIVSIWGIIKFLGVTFGFKTAIPQLR